MDLNQLKHLTDEQKTRYMQLERLFAQPGWDLVEALAQELAMSAKDRAAFAKSWDANRIAVGQGYAYSHIASLRDNTEKEYEALASAAAQKVADQDEIENE